jgi:hypothetical protein
VRHQQQQGLVVQVAAAQDLRLEGGQVAAV